MQLMQQAASTLPTVAAERLSSELESILIHPQAALGLDLLTQANVIAAILPEVKAMDDVVQNEYHQFTVGKHSRRAFAAFVEMVHSGRYLPLAIRQPFANYWQSLTTEIQAAAMLAAWLHDIGKPATRAICEGRVTFYRHEQVGAKMALDIARRLRLSSAQRTLIRRFIELHMYPAQLHASKNFGPRLIHRFYKRAGQHGPLIVVFALADYLAKAEGVAGTKGFVTRCQAVTDFLQAYFCQQAELVDPQPLLDGVELMALACLGPGPWLRVVKEELLEAQVAAEVHNKEQAANWLQGWLKKNSGRLPDQPK